MAEYTRLVCPRCGNIMGDYNEELEERRSREHFKSYCCGCMHVVKPIYR